MKIILIIIIIIHNNNPINTDKNKKVKHANEYNLAMIM
jgi:hypothetical protein